MIPFTISIVVTQSCLFLHATIEVTKEMIDYVGRSRADYERSKEKDRIEQSDFRKRAFAKKRITEEIKELEAKRARVVKEANTEQNLLNEKLFNLRSQYDHS